MDDIAQTAMMFVDQAAKYADRAVFRIPEAFDMLHDSIDLFAGTHFQSASTRRYFFEALNVALSGIPGNQVSVRCVELTGGAFTIEWLPYVDVRPANVRRV